MTAINGVVQGSTFAVMPSVMYMVTKPNLLRDVDIRPYVGGGLNYVHASRRRADHRRPGVLTLRAARTAWAARCSAAPR